jgi:hypothetical protein
MAIALPGANSLASGAFAADSSDTPSREAVAQHGAPALNSSIGAAANSR